MEQKKMMGWFIIIVMSLSVLGYVGGSFFDQETAVKKVEYNGYEFYNESGWMLQLSGQRYTFTYFPTELEQWAVPIKVKDWFTAEKVYLAYRPEDNFSVTKNIQQVGAVLYSQNIIPQISCTIEGGCPDIPIIDCNDKNGIIFSFGVENGFSSNNNCLIVTAKNSEEMEQMTERLIYELLGVIK